MKHIVLHPFLFGLYPVLFLYANNIDRVFIYETYRVFLVVSAAMIILLGLFRFILRCSQRAGIVTTILIGLFSSYGHMYQLFSNTAIFGIRIGNADVLAAIWASSWILLTWAAIRIVKRPQSLGYLLNIVSFFLILLPLGKIGQFTFNQVLASPDKKAETEVWANQYPPDPRPPDIYYIILDEYGRADVLKEIMSFDNRDFMQYLKEKGFYIAEGSRSNYSLTNYSLASSLNYRYLSVHEQLNSNLQFMNEIHNNRAREFLESKGYLFITVATGYPFSDIRSADLYLQPDDYLNGFEMNYIFSTVLSLWSDEITGTQARKIIDASFENLAQIPMIEPEKPKFVFAHTPGVHVPFVFGANGEHVRPWGFSVNGSKDERTYEEGYTAQLTYINRLVKKTIDRILATSTTEPIIILQSDHGSQLLYNRFSYQDTCLKDRLSILNAYYLPGYDGGDLYPSITPVNTFRLIFNHYFGTEYEFEANRSYFVDWSRPGEIIDATDEAGTCTIPGQ